MPILWSFKHKLSKIMRLEKANYKGITNDHMDAAPSEISCHNHLG